MNNVLQTEKILGIKVTNEPKDKILEYVDDLLETRQKQYYFVTPNPEMIVRSTKDKKVKDILNGAEASLVDGVGLVMAGKILGIPLRERFSGVDFVAEVCKRYARKPVNIGFLGGKKNVAELTAECLREAYPELQIAFVAEEWSEEGFAQAKKYYVASSKYYDEEKQKSLHTTRSIIPETHAIDILFVAFGFPKQEEWIVEHLPNLPVKIAIGVGGAFDYLSGSVPRAPQLWQAWGLEWLYRLIQQPWRWRRQVALVEFIGLVLKEKAHLGSRN